MKISLLHPSRGRSKQAFETADTWLDRSSKKYAIQYIMCVDSDDADLNQYTKALFLFRDIESIYNHLMGFHFSIVEKPNYVVHAVNEAANMATGDMLIMVSDDFEPPFDWDISLMQAIQNKMNQSFVVMVSDNCNKKRDVITLPIMSAKAYRQFGYFFHPAFKSMWADNYLYYQAREKGLLVDARHIVFTHHHFTNDNVPLRNPVDETYVRSNNFYKEGEQIFLQLTNQ